MMKETAIKNQNTMTITLQKYTQDAYDAMKFHKVTTKKSLEALIEGIRYIVNVKHDFSEQEFTKALSYSDTVAMRVFALLAYMKLFKFSRKVGRTDLFIRDNNLWRIKVIAILRAAKVRFLEKSTGVKTKIIEEIEDLIEELSTPAK